MVGFGHWLTVVCLFPCKFRRIGGRGCISLWTELFKGAPPFGYGLTKEAEHRWGGIKTFMCECYLCIWCALRGRVSGALEWAQKSQRPIPQAPPDKFSGREAGGNFFIIMEFVMVESTFTKVGVQNYYSLNFSATVYLFAQTLTPFHSGNYVDERRTRGTHSPPDTLSPRGLVRRGWVWSRAGVLIGLEGSGDTEGGE